MVTKKPTDKEIFEKLDFAFDGLDSERAKGLQRLKIFHLIKNDGAVREKNRLKAKYGAEHHRVKKLDERFTYNIGLSKELDVEIERTEITQPFFDINIWMVHGRVLDKEGKGISELTVSLYDEKGTRIEQLGYACTDERGYFAIRYKADPEKGSEIPEDQKLILTVTDANAKVLHKETEPLFVKVGQIDFRLIVLDDKEEPCVPPGQGDHGDLNPDTWVVRGKVFDQDEQPLGGLTVSLYDKDLLFDDKLGSTVTDEDGHFMLSYPADDLRDLIEANPDIYVKVLDKGRKTLYSSRKSVKCEGGRVEVFNIKVKRKVKDEVSGK